MSRKVGSKFKLPKKSICDHAKILNVEFFKKAKRCFV